MGKQGGYNLKWETREILSYLKIGRSDRAIADIMGCTTSAVIGVRSRVKSGYYKDIVIPPPPVASLPPSLAMIRLAEFDPVIKRALLQRKGEGQ